MVSALVFMGMTIGYLRNMSLAAKQAAKEQGPARPALSGPALADAQAAWQETVVPGPSDEDAVEQEEVKPLFEAVSDAQPNAAAEMAAYWRLMKWARAGTFAELQKRANRDVPFVKLWEEPEKHRGELIQLRLHVLRVISWDAPKNSAGVGKVYEVWGWTDSSKNPYVTIVSELPPGLTEGSDVHGEALFVGYFFKILSYNAFNDVRRGAPLLIGRVKSVTPTAPPPVLPTSWGKFPWQAMVAGGALLALMLGSFIWKLTRRPQSRNLSISPADKVPVEEWLGTPSELPAAPSNIPDFERELHEQLDMPSKQADPVGK